MLTHPVSLCGPPVMVPFSSEPPWGIVSSGGGICVAG